MVNQGLDVLAEATPVVHDVEGKPQPVGEPVQVGVDAGRLPVGVGEDGAVRDAVERSLAGHEGHDRGLHAAAEADDGQRLRGTHQLSASLPLSGDPSV